MKIILFMLLLVFFGSVAGAEIVTETIEYRQGNTVLEGYLAYDKAITGKRPGVAVVHEWTGINDYTKMRTEKLAGMGYVALAVDIYGKGIRPLNSEEAAAQAKIYRSDRQLMRERIKAGVDFLKKQKLVDSMQVAAIGYCFGGGAVLELARSGAAVSGVVSFHGNLDTPNPDDARNIRCKVLVLHGADDPYVPAEQVTAFQAEMRQAGVDWQMIFYGGAVHSFTNPGAGDDPSRGTAYNASADRRSWQAMKQFFGEIFNR
nr:dienelactone hydrolase family protein [candidate division Zixibacteria bacterium]